MQKHTALFRFTDLLAIAALPMTFSAMAIESTQSQVETLVVTASGYEQSSMEAPASISVIDKAQIENRAYKDLTDALKDIPGVVITGGGSRQEISLRGMPADYTAILVDGRRQSGRQAQVSSGGGFEQDWLPPISAIERIEVVRGPMSTLYGSDAIGGVINIITRKDFPKWTGSLRTEAILQEAFDSGDHYQGEAYLAGPLMDGLLSASVSGLYQDRAEDKILYGNAGKSLTNVRSSLYFTPTLQDVFALDYTEHDQERINSAGNTRPKSSETNNERQSIGLGHQANYDKVTGTSYLSSETVKNIGRNLSVENQNAKTQWTSALGMHYLSVGAAFEKQALDNGRFVYKNSQWSVFVEDEWSLTDEFALTLGLRYDDNEQFDSHLSPRIYGVWFLNPDWAVKGGVSTGYRAPNLTEVEEEWVQESCNGKCDLYGNLALKPESSVNTEFGLYYSGSDSLNANLTVFYNEFSDKIEKINLDPNCTGNSCDATYENIDDAITYGTEASISKPITDTIKFSGSYTYTYSEQTSGINKGRPLTQMPKHLLALNGDWAICDDINSWLRASYRSKESEPVSIEPRNISAPSLMYLDVGANWKLNDQVKLMASIYNILNTKITYDEYGYVADGRRYWLGAELSF